MTDEDYNRIIDRGSRRARNMCAGLFAAIVLAALLMLLALTFSTASAQAIGHDKYDHAAACYGVEYTLSECKPFKAWKPWQRALFTTAVIGGGKEWYDHNHPEHHTAEWGDIAADAVGAFGAEGAFWLVHKDF